MSGGHPVGMSGRRWHQACQDGELLPRKRDMVALLQSPVLQRLHVPVQGRTHSHAQPCKIIFTCIWGGLLWQRAVMAYAPAKLEMYHWQQPADDGGLLRRVWMFWSRHCCEVLVHAAFPLQQPGGSMSFLLGV